MSLKSVTKSDALLTLQQDDDEVSLVVHTPGGYSCEIGFFCGEGTLHLTPLSELDMQQLYGFVELEPEAKTIAVYYPAEPCPDGGDLIVN